MAQEAVSSRKQMRRGDLPALGGGANTKEHCSCGALTGGGSRPPGLSSLSTVRRQSGHTHSGRCSTLLPLGAMERASLLAVLIPLSRNEESFRSLLHRRQQSPAG